MFMKEEEAADYLNINRFTFRSWRKKGEKTGRFPITYYRVGMRPMYMKKDLDEFIESVKLNPGDNLPGPAVPFSKS